ncbi:MAG: RluA family pseudouridine synthase [Elusimicrobiota bacterium]
MTLNILFENKRVLAVDKPTGIIVIPDQYTDISNTLQGKVSNYINKKAFVVHRIDRDTSGVLLFAKDAEAHAFLCAQFEAGEVKKKYLTLVRGVMPKDEGSIIQPITITARRVAISAMGKYSVTDYKVLERFINYSYLEVSPQTGRRHQIRIHLWHAGYPLAVDPEYTHTNSIYLSDIKRNYKKKGKEKPLIGRLSLHAASITFKEPEEGKEMTVESPLPKDFEVTLKQLRKYNK